MTSVTPKLATQVVLREIPVGFVNSKFGQSDSTFAIHVARLSELQEGQLLIETSLISNDPAQREWIRSKHSGIRHYAPAIEIGAPMESYALGKVIESKSEKYQQGDIVTGKFYWADFAIVEENRVFNKTQPDLKVPPEYYLSILGMTSWTALLGLTEAGGLKKYLTEKPQKLVVLVSAASGATGSVVVQVAKHLLGATKVIGITGSDEKCQWVNSLGADFSVNYKDPNYQEKLDKYLGDELVDVYFDNVGGLILNYALTKMAKYGTVISCGSIATYNGAEQANVSNWREITVNSLTVKGFIVTDYYAQIPEAVQILTKAVKEGKLRTKDAYHVETLSGNDLSARLEQIPKIWDQLFSGEKPNGKLLTKLK